MNDLSSLVEGVLSQLGRAFFLSGFIPILIGVALNQYLLFHPDYSNVEQVWNLFPAIDNPVLGFLSGEWTTTIVVSLVLAVIILPLNSMIIKIFEGYFPGSKAALFPIYLPIVQRYRRYYARIQEKRNERRQLMVQLEDAPDDDPSRERIIERIYAVEEEIHPLHHSNQKDEPVPLLPFNRELLLPTGFGNAWAVMEETPLTRYGIDSKVFWPYLRAVAGDDMLLESIDNQKLLIDIAIHLALVMAILTVEGLVLGILRGQATFLILAVIAAILFIAFYQAGVSYTKNMGVMVIQAFDLHRSKILDAFGLKHPVDLDDEYWVWTRLSAFLRRSEPFYFDMLEKADGD